MLNRIRKNVVSGFSTITGGASIIGSYSACQTVCVSGSSILAFFGVVLAGTPLLFLQQYSVPLWSIAAIALVASAAIFFYKSGYIRKELLLANVGLVMAGIPFAELKPFSANFMTVGFALVGIAALLYVKSKLIK